MAAVAAKVGQGPASGPGAVYDPHRGAAPLLRPTVWWRTAAFMVVNLIGFAVVCAFWGYLATGRWMEFTPAAYARDLKTPIGESFIQPLGVLRYPWMILVTGLLLAITVFVPIIVAVLYRLRFSALFVLLVAGVAHAPLLAAFTALGCLLAAKTYLRSDMPFMASILGMLPIAGYLYILGFMGVETVAVMPLQRWVLYAPFVIALVAAVLAAAAVLTLARLTGYRPGAVWPVLALMLAGPIVAFYLRVGPDELDYAVMARPLAAGRSLFPQKPLREWMNEAAAEGHGRLTLRTRLQDDMESKGRHLATRCRRFVQRYPRSRRVPEVLWLQAYAESLQLDGRAQQRGIVRYSAWQAHPAAAGTWRRLLEEHGGTAPGALARWRLGELAARDEKAGRADEMLRTAAASLVEVVTRHAQRRAEQTGRIFLPRMTVPTDGHYENALFAAQRLVWLMETNQVLEDPVPRKALAAYLKLPSGEPRYHEDLKALASQYGGSPLADNLRLAAARVDPDRIGAAQTFLELARQGAPIDARIEASYELAQLAIRPEVRRRLPQLRTPQTYLQVVIDGPTSPWRRLALKQLALTPTSEGRAP